MKMEQTERSEMSAYKSQTPGNYPEENKTFRTKRKFEIKGTRCSKHMRLQALMAACLLG